MIRLRENLRALFYAPFYLAHELGLFSASGVDVALERSDDPIDSAAQLLAGKVDVCWGGPLRVLRIRDDDPQADVVCFGEVVGRDPFLVVGRGDLPLESMRIGAVSEVVTPWICLRQDLIDRGVDPSTMDVSSASSMGENLVAFARGELDGFQAFQPFAERAIRDAGAVVVSAGADRGPTAYTSFYSTRERVEARGEEFAAMVAAMRRSVALVYERSGADTFSAIRTWFPDMDAELAGAALDRYRAHEIYNRSGVLSRQGFDRLQRSMLTAGFVTGTSRYDDCVVTV